ncbi:MAG: hypothetical protein ACI9U2_005135 [Bradymonadia bacterium]|jgi:hypothetical protein
MTRSIFGLTLTIVIAALGTFVVPTTASAVTTVKLSKSAFSYSGVRYYRGKVENVKLCSYGEKKTPITQANYLAVQNNVPGDTLSKVAVQIEGPFPIEWSKFSKTDVDAAISYLKVGGGTGSFNRAVAMKANLKLVKFYLNEGPLTTLLNKYANGARNHLAKEGADGRIASEVWVVMEAKLASDVANGGSVTGTASDGGFKVQLGGSGSSKVKTTITVPPGTTFAYLLHKVKKWNKGKTKVENMQDDQHGPF